MKRQRTRSFNYCPVVHENRHLVKSFYPYPFLNVTRLPKKSAENGKAHVRQENYCDSGGYQIYQLENREKTGETAKGFLIIPGVGLRTTEDYLVLDPVEICKQYERNKVKYGMTLDLPMSEDLSEAEYREKRDQSYLSAQLMFDLRETLCPETNLIIPLQYSTKTQLYDYYKKMSRLYPDGYAIPVRYTNNWTDMLIIAYTLSFLSHEKVDIVHLLGSSRAEIVVLGAAAIGLGLFDRISFDSTTWNQQMYGGKLIYFDSDTLKRRVFTFEGEWELLLPKEIADDLQGRVPHRSLALAKELVGLHNVNAFAKYAEEKLKLSRDIDELIEYIEGREHLQQQRRRLLHAIFLMTESKEKGHQYIEKWYDCVWGCYH